MTHVKNVLCLMSEDADVSAGLRHCQKLMGTQETGLHVMSIREPKSSVTEESIRTIVGDEWGETDVKPVVASLPGPVNQAVGTIRSYVREKDVDLVIVDPPLHGTPVPPLANELTSRLIERLDCPVLAHQSAKSGEIDKIVVPTDLSEASYESLKVATDLAREYDASILLVHVIDTSPYVALKTIDRLSMGNMTLSEHRAHRQLQRFVADGASDVSIDTSLLFGDPADRIVHFIEDEDIDLLVLSSHGRETSSERPLGSVADRILRRITCAVYLLPVPGRLMDGGTNGTSPRTD